ncbi:hypothetical protein [Aliiglaciecola litoralis]|uniref:Uncharacterized protein n=1 Tax=Aliiglaciecola litoralis TaxID=582857 RepID=A0ABP3X7H3_9ALTE
MSDMDDELIKKYPIWLSLLAMLSTFSILRLSRELEFPYWQGLVVALVVALGIFQVWFAIRNIRLKKLKSSFKSSVKSKS